MEHRTRPMRTCREGARTTASKYRGSSRPRSSRLRTLGGYLGLLTALLFLIGSPGLVGCSAGLTVGEVRSNYDKFTDTREDLVNITANSMLIRRSRGSSPTHYVWGTVLTTIGREPARIERLVLLADGTPITLLPDARKEQVAGYLGLGNFGYVEAIQYPITASQIRTCAMARVLEGRAYSSTRTFEGGMFKEQEHAAIRKFYEQFVLGEAN